MTYITVKDTLDRQAIEDDALIYKILNDLGFWETRNHDPPQLDSPHISAIEAELTHNTNYSQRSPIDHCTQ